MSGSVLSSDRAADARPLPSDLVDAATDPEITITPREIKPRNAEQQARPGARRATPAPATPTGPSRWFG